MRIILLPGDSGSARSRPEARSARALKPWPFGVSQVFFSSYAGSARLSAPVQWLTWAFFPRTSASLESGLLLVKTLRGEGADVSENSKANVSKMLATAPQNESERCGTRTHDSLIKSEVLYH